MKRGLIFVVLGFIALTQYVNCSSYSDSTLGNDSLSSVTDTVTTYEGVKALNGDTYMNCDEDHVQIGGTCNTADTRNNYIQYTISRDRVPVGWGTDANNLIYHLEIAKCENGRFFAVVPKPNDNGLTVAGTDYLEYRLDFQIFTSTDGLQFKAGEKSPGFMIYIQKNGGCGG